MSVLIFLVVSYILLSLSLYLLFPKAGVEAKKGLIPMVNFMEWAKLIGRKPGYAWWLLFPVVNLFIFCGMAVDLARSFNKYQFWHSALAVIYAPAMIWLIARNKADKYGGPILPREAEYKQQLEEAIKAGKTRQVEKLQQTSPYRKSAAREWTEAIVFAVFAASFIRMFLIEAYKIPTPSMEGSLLVGDFLFVSKAHYGIRAPMTVLQWPLLHNRLPFDLGESYLEKPSLPYFRLPALEKIDRNEPIVFNWPVGDSVYLSPVRSYTAQQVRMNPEVKREIGNAPLITRPIDKKDHYIKRCIAIAGDSLQVINKQVYVNGQPVQNPKNLEYMYQVQSNGMNWSRVADLGIQVPPNKVIPYFLTSTQVEQLKSLDPNAVIEPVDMTPYSSGLFPFDPVHFNWSVDNYGPIYIPKKGATVELKPETIALYRRVIDVYENNDFKEENGQYIINGIPSTTYTFKQDYYWAMGDNRHNSEDSRAWGFVPFDHIVGKPLFIWFSTKNGNLSEGINWNRIFTSAYKMD